MHNYYISEAIGIYALVKRVRHLLALLSHHNNSLGLLETLIFFNGLYNSQSLHILLCMGIDMDSILLPLYAKKSLQGVLTGPIAQRSLYTRKFEKLNEFKLNQKV